MPGPAPLGDQVKDLALSLGFAKVGFAPARRFEEAAQRADEWIRAGLHGEMAYLEPVAPRAEPCELLPEARTLIVVALAYGGSAVVPLRRSEKDPTTLAGTVARYAVGEDYHHVLKHKLLHLTRGLAALLGRPVLSRACVDTAPLLEREAARRAGIGFVGKNGLVIAPRVGSFVLLGELLVDVDLPESDPVAAGCGRCTACLDACPTGAFVGPYVLDARRCISYLTIETKGPIPRDLRPLIGNRVLGCDVCQDVCPFNASSEARPYQPALGVRPELDTVDLVRWLTLGAAEYRKVVKRTALRRVGKRQLQRNAAVALGNRGDPRAVAPLADRLASDPSPLVREHAAWALGRLGGEEAHAALRRATRSDPDEGVRAEARQALGSLPPDIRAPEVVPRPADGGRGSGTA